MKSELKMFNKILLTIIGAFIVFSAKADSIPDEASRQLIWRVGAEFLPSWVAGTNAFLRGDNSVNKRVDLALSGDLRFDFQFNPLTRNGMLYRGLYQGIGVGVRPFYAKNILGTPGAAYVYQGAPICHFNNRLWFGYEWQFGAAFGWRHYQKESDEFNTAVGGPVTAHMGVAFKLNYNISPRWMVSLGFIGNHYSNGNTSLPNGGVNSLGGIIGIAYTINPLDESLPVDTELEREANRHRWSYDIVAYGAWRRRIVVIGDPAEPELCPGKFGILGLQFAPLFHLNRWVGIGPSLDIQWDESAGIEPYWVSGSHDENLLFERPPFGKQVSAGLSAHAELTMPIFAINAGLGYDILCPHGNKRFYQSLTLKTFVTSKLFLNVGYRLGNFSSPQNLMLGVGVRL